MSSVAPSRRTLGSLLRQLAAAPAYLYDLGLGRLLAHRFLLLVHRGRRSGRRRRTILEVISWDERRREAVVISGLGPSAGWRLNVLAGGAEEVRIGGERFRPQVREVAGEEAFSLFSEFERRNRLLMPVARPLVSRLAGFDYDGSPAARRQLLVRMPLLALRAPPADQAEG
ncbi:MAG TPA: nitroreductase family deazaflavin-dependent oxidoreductase [Solirubrobacterales bacterium]|nr:nitroreductase family deazaflavin-dependent oxidoreductase [Solirubrobacterales bacterium]